MLLHIAVMALLALQVARAQDVVGDLFNRINTLRASLGLPAYTLNAALMGAAQSQAEWMALTGSVTHTRPDGSSPRSRAAAYGYSSTWVSENIYMGTMASVDSAWNFWINSSIHYAGLTNINYSEIGIGTAHTDSYGSAFVLVFGNPGGLFPTQPAASNNASAPSGLPPYVKGNDEHGNIMHEIQPDDTLGDILLIYGYTWADLPYILQLNGMTEADYRSLEVGKILLIPPHDGTYTPTPAELTPEVTAETTQSSDLGILPTSTLAPSFTPTVTLSAISVAQSVPESVSLAAAVTPSPEVTAEPTTLAPTVFVTTDGASVLAVPTGGTEIAAAATPAPVEIVRGNNTTSPLLIVAVVVQVAVLVVAGVEFIRRMRR